MSAVDARSSRRGLVITAVGYQWFYNGANFIAFKVSTDALQPLLVGSMRFLIAGLLVLPFAWARRRSAPLTGLMLAHAALLGVVMLVIGQAVAMWGVHFLPAGVASVFGSSAPLFLVILAWAVFGQLPSWRQGAGVLVGFAGLALMALSSSNGGGFSFVGAAMTLVATASWALGSLLSSRLTLPRDPVVALSAQLLTAGLVLTGVVLVSGIAGDARFAAVPVAGWAAVAFLTIASTLVGYAVFLWVDAQASPTLANTYNYAAPVIALGLSALILHEPLTVTKALAGLVTLSGVALMVGAEGEKKQESSL